MTPIPTEANKKEQHHASSSSLLPPIGDDKDDDEKYHAQDPTVATAMPSGDLFQGDLCDDELDEIPSAPEFIGASVAGGCEDFALHNSVEAVERVVSSILDGTTTPPSTTTSNSGSTISTALAVRPSSGSSPPGIEDCRTVPASSPVSVATPVQAASGNSTSSCSLAPLKRRSEEQLGGALKRRAVPVVTFGVKSSQSSSHDGTGWTTNANTTTTGNSRRSARVTRSRATKKTTKATAKTNAAANHKTTDATTTVSNPTATHAINAINATTTDERKLTTAVTTHSENQTATTNGNASCEETVTKPSSPVTTTIVPVLATTTAPFSKPGITIPSVAASIVTPALVSPTPDDDHKTIVVATVQVQVPLAPSETTTSYQARPSTTSASAASDPPGTTANTVPPAAAAAATAPAPPKNSNKKAKITKDTPDVPAAAQQPLSPGSVMVVDTSTAHIKALTGENGASVCLGARSASLGLDHGTSSAASVTSSNDGNNNNGSKQQSAHPMTEQQRVQQSRDRNRRHARNTRLRKKAYVEELKVTLNELVAQRDAALVLKQQNHQRELEQREVRFRVMEEFLNLRGRNETDTGRWSAILQEDFSLKLPNTRDLYGDTSGIDCRPDQILVGVSHAMGDAQAFAGFLQTLAPAGGATISLLYQIDRKNFLMDGCNAVLDWTASSVGAVQRGAKAELTMWGTLKAIFCPDSNKLRSTDLVFDTGCMLAQKELNKGLCS